MTTDASHILQQTRVSLSHSAPTKPLQFISPVDIRPFQSLLQKIHSIQNEMSSIIIEREEATFAALLGLIAKQHVFYYGPFGTAKSFLFAQIAQRFSDPSGGLRYFKRLLSADTRPEQLFGMPSLNEYKKNDILRYNTSGMLPEAELAFLDEFFKAEHLSGTLLALMEEREFENPLPVHVPLISVFAASNEVPRPDTMAGRASWDRFIIRVHVDRLSDPNFIAMMKLGSVPSPTSIMSKNDLETLHQIAYTIPIPDSIYQSLYQLRLDLKQQGIEISERRWMHSREILQAHALFFGRGVVEEDDLSIFQWMWDDPGQIADLRRACAQASNPMKAEAIRLCDLAANSYSEALKAQEIASLSDEQRGAIAFEAARKLRQTESQLQQLYTQAAQEGRNATGIQPLMQEVHQKRMHLNAIALGEPSQLVV